MTIMRHLCILIALLGVTSGRNTDNADSLDEETLALPDDDETPFRNAIKDRSRAFTNGVVPYTISRGFSAAQLKEIKDKMSKIEFFTKSGNTPCITFRPKTTADRGYLKIMKSLTHCNSKVGMSDLPTTLNLRNYCFGGDVVTRLLMQALGFYYEHTRPDRDYSIAIDWANINEGSDPFYAIQTNTMTQNIPYDYASVMQYIHPTLIPKRGNYFGGRRPAIGLEMSWYDVVRVQKFYQCQENSTEFKSYYEKKMEIYCTFDDSRWCSMKKNWHDFDLVYGSAPEGQGSDRGYYFVAKAKNHQGKRAVWESYGYPTGCYNLAIAYYSNSLKDGNELTLYQRYQQNRVDKYKELLKVSKKSGDFWSQAIAKNLTIDTYWNLRVVFRIGPNSTTDIFADDLILSHC